MAENFPVASVLLPRWSRSYVRAFYNFARRADDIADDGALAPDVRRACLDALDDAVSGGQGRTEGEDAPEGLASALASARVLRDMLADADLSTDPARKLLAAFRLDTQKARWDSWDDLMGYCALSAVPVGRFLLSLLGGARDGGASVDALTSALQVLNHVQDVKADYRALGRIYLPQDILFEAGVVSDDLTAAQTTGPLRAVLDGVLDRTDRLLDDADGVARDIHSLRLGLEAAVILEIARALSAKLRGSDPLAARVKLDRLEYAVAIARGLVRGGVARWLNAGIDDEAARTVRGAKSSFFWGMRILPRKQRTALYAIYAFCRAVDDVADDTNLNEAEKQAELDLWQAEIEALYHGDMDAIETPLVHALVVPVRQFGLKKKDFLDVIAGMRSDACRAVRIPDQVAFDLYCDRVAAAVGRLANPVFGFSGDEGDALATALGRAMQTTNILRDLREDAARARLYLPLDLLAAHGVAVAGEGAASVEAILADPHLGAVLEELARRAEDDFRTALGLLEKAPSRTAAPVRVMLEVYHRLLTRLRRRGLVASLAAPRVRISPVERLWIAVRYGVLHGR